MTCKDWISFVKKYRTQHPTLSYKEALKKASPLWKKKDACKTKRGKQGPKRKMKKR